MVRNFKIVGLWLLTLSLLVGCSEPAAPVKAKALHRFTTGTVLSAVMSKDTRIVSILTDDQQLTAWHSGSKKTLQRWDKSHFGDTISNIAISGDGKKLCVAGHWNVTMLNVVDGSVITSWDAQGYKAGATVSTLHVDQNGHNVLIGMTDGAVLSVDMNSQKALKLDHHKNQVTRLLYGADNQTAMSGSTDKNFAYWKTANGEIIYQHNFRSRVTTIALDSESNKLFVSDALKAHWILDASNGKELTELSFFERFRYFRLGLFVQNGDVLITSSPKNVLTSWQTATGEELQSWEIKRFTADATTVAISTNPEGDLVTLSSDGALQVWDF